MRENEKDLRLLRHSMEIARRSREKGNHPFGAILVDGMGKILLEAENTVVTENDITGHSETNLIRLASNQYDSQYPDPIMTVYGNFANPKFDAVKVAEGLTDYDVVAASRNEEVLTKIASTFNDDLAIQFKSTPITTFLGQTGPEADLLTDIVRG